MNKKRIYEWKKSFKNNYILKILKTTKVKQCLQYKEL